MGEAVIPSLEAIGVKCLQVYDKNDVVKTTHKSIVHQGQNFNMSVPFLDLNGRDVWGATGAILNELKVILSS